MAKLLYVCPDSDLNQFGLPIEMAQAMISCSHQVRILTTYSEENENLPSLGKVEMLMPFKNWSVVELPKLILATQTFKPDIVQFFYSSQRHDASQLFSMMLPSYFKSLFGSKLVFYITDQIEKRTLGSSQWLNQSDLVITKDHFQMLKVSSLIESPNWQMHLCLSPGLRSENISNNQAWLKTKFEKLIYCMGYVRTVTEAIQIVRTCEYILKSNEKMGLVLNIENLNRGYWAERELVTFLQDNFLEGQVYLTRSVGESENAELIQACDYLFVAHLGLESLQLSLAFDSLLEPHQVVMATQQQGYFAGQSLRGQVNLVECRMGKPLFDETMKPFEVHGPLEAKDAISADPMNALNRAYSHLLQ